MLFDFITWIISLFWWAFDHFTPVGITATATVIYAFFAIFQWTAIRRQSDVLMSLNAPKIVIHNIQYRHEVGQISVLIFNHGHTIAFIDKVCINISTTNLPARPYIKTSLNGLRGKLLDLIAPPT